MRKLLLAAMLTVLMPAAANATAWIAACYDGKNLQYNQIIGGKGTLFLQKDDGNYQSLALVQSSYEGNVVCGVADDKQAQAGGLYIKVCADKANNTITVKYKDPTGKGLSIDDTAPYCGAAVTVH